MDTTLGAPEIRALRSNWSRYHSWEQQHSLDALASLSTPPRARDRVPEYPRDEELSAASTGYDSESFTISDVPAGSITVVSVQVTEAATRFPPYPPYEMCAPASRSDMVGDDPVHMPFIPFSDDPSFNLERYLEEYPHAFSWQNPVNDTGLEMVISATAKECTGGHPPLPFADKHQVEALMQLLPKPMSFAQLCRRMVDMPKGIFPGPSPSEVQLLHNTKPRDLLSNLLRDFCSNPSCVVGFCPVHVGDIPFPTIIPPRVSTFIPTSPCGLRCFLFRENFALEAAWDAREIDLLEAVLDYSPDLSTCDLATICDKPCREVYSYLSRMIPEPLPADRLEQPILPSFSSDHDASKFVPEGPCGHDGPCDAKSQCRCVLNNAQCESSCRCDRSCHRRGRGCNCRKSRNGVKPCKTSRCPCFEADRECDPDLCVSCEARDFDADNCQNAGIQQGRFRRMEVRESKWGLGVFMSEAAKKHDLIIEYIGELMYDASIDTRDLVAKHRGRNYVFQLNQLLSIDGSTLGNESRFINHDKERHNCYARVKLVNGEHRIGIYAAETLNVGTELLYNYGLNFFPDDLETQSRDAGGQRSNISLVENSVEPSYGPLPVGDSTYKPSQPDEESDDYF